MRTIDAREWDPAVVRALQNAIAEGGAEIRVSDNSRVVVIDIHLWNVLSQRLPSLTEIFEEIRDAKSGSED